MATIPAGSNRITFNHQFPTTPGLVIVTGTNNAHRYSATATSTQITIATEANVGAATPVYWRGWIKP
jgi:hypothetical protein